MKTGDEKLTAARRRVEQIQKVEPFPKAAIQKYFVSRKKEENKRFKEHQKSFAEECRFVKTAWAPLLALIDDEKRRAMIQTLAQKSKKSATPLKIRPPIVQRMEPNITGGSITQFLTPPYYEFPQQINGDGAGSINGSTGYVNDFVVGNGGSSSVWGGIFVIFSPISYHVNGKIQPILQILSQWHEESYGYTAHTSGSMSTEVIDLSDMTWPVGGYSSSQIVWADGVSFGESHDGGNGWQYAWAPEVWFPLTRGHQYLATISITASADDSSGWLGLGPSFAKATLMMSVLNILAIEF